MSRVEAGNERDETFLPIGGVVAVLQDDYPDVTRSSLRFLDREGLLTATRTPGGHRLYSAADIDRIRQIKTWQGQRLSLDDIRRRLLALDRLPPPAEMAEEFLRSALAGESAAAYDTILAADDLGVPLATLFGDVLQPALHTLGQRWEQGDLLVAQEKEVSELVRDLIAELTLRHARAGGGPVLVAACVEGERHELGLRMIRGLLRQEGYVVHYLGADVAPRFLLEAVQLHRPAAILLSAKLAPNLPAVQDAIRFLIAGLSPETTPPIVVGGEAAIGNPELVRAWGAEPVQGDDLPAALATVAEAVAREGAPDRSR